VSTLEDRLNGSGGVPWIPDPSKAEKYDKDSCGLNPLIGTAVDHYRRQNFMGDGEYDVLVLSVADVGDVAVHCQPTVLANEMRSARPRPGEKVGVKWLGERQGANRSYAAYKVVVERAAGGDFNWGDSAEPEARQEWSSDSPPSLRAEHSDDEIPF